MRPKFIPPFVRQDGSFCVVTKFLTTQDAANQKDQVNDWCSQWVEEYKDWQPSFSKDFARIDKGPWDYFEIFTGPPYVIKAEANKLWLRLDGRVYSYWWRDWFAFMLKGLSQAFPELQRESGFSYNCDDSTD